MNNNKKRILFVIPPYFSEQDPQKPVFTIPYGILSIDAYIKKNSNTEIKSEILDLNIELYKKKELGEMLDKLKRKIRDNQPDIIAISALFDTQFKYLKLISDTIKEIDNDILIVAGGGLPTSLYNKILETHNIDAICYGEGELPMINLINAENYDSLIDVHPSWVNKKNYRHKIPRNSLIDDLDDIPEFDYSLINLDNYNCRSLDKVHKNEMKKEMSIHTSRGCPYDCIFCSNGNLHGKKVRYMSINKVVNDIKNMVENYGMNTLLIEDDNFLFNKERAKNILKELASFNIKIEFPNGLMVSSIDEEIAKLMRCAGVTTVPLAIESGSDYVLQKIIKKPLSTKIIRSKVDMLRKNNINIHAFIIVGLPGETNIHRLETLNMLKEIGFDWVHVFVAIPVTGSRLYNICINNNYLINDDINSNNISNANIKAPGVDPKEIENFAYFLNIYINFMENYNMRTGNFDIARRYFENVVQKYPFHAFAQYCLNHCLNHCSNHCSKVV